jgi:hypothetical protein
MPLVRPTNCDRLERFISSITTVLESRRLPESLGWPYDAQQFFQVMLTLIRYLNLYSQREPSWIESLHSHGLPSDPPFDWRVNDAVASLQIEHALDLIEDWPTNILPIVNENELRFKRLCAEYGRHCPKALSDIRVRQFGNKSRSSGQHHEVRQTREKKKPHVRSREERVRDAIEYLLKTNQRVSLRGVCRIARLGFQSLRGNVVLYEMIQKGIADDRRKQELEVQDAVKIIRARGLEVSTATLGIYVGRSYRYLKKRNGQVKFR